MKYNVGDKVRIKSLDWYNKNKDEDGDVPGAFFSESLSRLCGTVQIIENPGHQLASGTIIYGLKDRYEFIGEEAIEGLEEFTLDRLVEIATDVWDKEDEKMETRYEKTRVHYDGEQWATVFECPDGYIFKDENGNVINATKIVLEKKKKEYPKTYEECCKVLNTTPQERCQFDFEPYGEELYNLHRLLICRDAYWKIAGEEMGLGKPWEPDWSDTSCSKYIIDCFGGEICKGITTKQNTIFAFPTPEMRDAFKENFDPDIEICKELL